MCKHIKGKCFIVAAFCVIASAFLFEQVSYSFLARSEVSNVNLQTIDCNDQTEPYILFRDNETRSVVPLPRLLPMQSVLALFRVHFTINADNFFALKNNQLAILPAKTIPLKLRT
jgi:hypothetical protein